MTTTRLYSIEQIAEALRSSDVRGPSRERVFDRLERMRSYTISEHLISEEDKANIHRFSESDIRVGLNQVLPNMTNTFGEVIRAIREAREFSDNVRRIRIEDLERDDLDKKVRFPAATIPRWQTLSDYMTVNVIGGVPTHYMVLDGRMAIVDDDVTFLIDDRRPDA